MKTTTRILIALLLVLSLSCAFCLFVSAEEADETTPEPEIAVSEENGASETEKTSFGDAVANFIGNHLTDIFSGAGLLICVILAYCWNKGLKPMVANALNRIHKSVDESSDTLSRQGDRNAETIAELLGKIQPFVGAATEMMQKLSSIKTIEEVFLIVSKYQFDMFGLLVESGRVPDSVKEQYRLLKAKADAEMYKIEGQGDPS